MLTTGTRRLLVAVLLAGGAMVSTAPAQAVAYSRYDDIYDPAGSISVGRPCYYRSWTHVDTAAIPPVRVVIDHYCTF